MIVDIYIDTSIKGPKRRDGAYLYILAVQTAAGVADIGNLETLPDATESSLTLTALEKALERIKKPCDLMIHLECPFVATVLENKWYEAWERNEWKTSKGEPVKDVEKWLRISEILNAHGFEVRLKEPHSYREWMARTLKDPENFKAWLSRRDKMAINGENTKYGG